MARFYCPIPLASGQSVDLPPTAARHVQVLRMQPGHHLTLFNGEGGEFIAEVVHMGRSDVRVKVGEHVHVEREATPQVHLAVGMPANERMDWLVEKATEMGVHRITPLMTERSVVRLSGERADKKMAHWQAVAASACEQCGRNRVPVIDLPERFDTWLARQKVEASNGVATVHAVLSLHASTQALHVLTHQPQLAPGTDAEAAVNRSWVLLNGPEGGLNDAEDAAARGQGFVPVSLGARVLRAETAALAALAMLTLA
jgi:16S rRNA (uracil1498-N3)-methyltransferase